MKKFLFTVSVCCILFLTLLPQAAPQDDPAVNIPDSALRAVIEAKLGKNSGDTITESEMNGMTDLLNADSKSISDLTDLEHATGLDRLYLNSNQITNIEPLKNLTNLEELRLNSNQITNIEPLKNLTNLTALTLQGNTKLSNISHLKNLVNLVEQCTISTLW